MLDYLYTCLQILFLHVLTCLQKAIYIIYHYYSDIYGKCSKTQFMFFFQRKFELTAGVHKMLDKIAKRGETLIRLLLQKQSDLGLCFLSRP